MPPIHHPRRCAPAALAVVLALGAAALSGPARASDNVFWSVGVAPAPGIVVGASNVPAVTYNPPRVVYTQPPVVYAPPPVYAQSYPVYVQPALQWVEPPWRGPGRGQARGHRHGHDHDHGPWRRD